MRQAPTHSTNETAALPIGAEHGKLMEHTIFDELDQVYQQDGIDGLLSRAEQELRDQQRFHELFEVRKMQLRRQLGLAMLPESDDLLDAATQRELEDGLLEICREVGLALLHAGRLQDGWHYLRHLTDRSSILDEIKRLPVDETNLDAVLGILLHEGLDIEHGYRLVLDHYGTCNAITTLQSALYGRSRQDRQTAGRLLLHHVHDELLQSVLSHVEKVESERPATNRLAGLIADRAYLFEGGTYHIDTSHLSSTVQIASELVDQPSLELAYDLTRYGQQLDPDLQYASDPPFEDTYGAYGDFFAAQLHPEQVELIERFRIAAEATDAHMQGTYPIEVYIDLLARVGRPADAIEATLQWIPEGTQTTGRAPNLLELSEQWGNFDRFREVCRQRNDVLGFLVAVPQSDSGLANSEQSPRTEPTG